MELHEVQARVEAGGAWMDAHAPEGWLGRIDLGTLNIANADLCVLGQTFRNNIEGLFGYNYAVQNMMSGSNVLAESLGFNEVPDEMPLLTAAWHQYITTRREEMALVA